MKYLLACGTDTGGRKTVNQDSLLLLSARYGEEQIVFAMVCDGMGGLSKGELASAEAVRAFSDWFKRGLPEILCSQKPEDRILSSWNLLLKDVDSQIKKYGKTHNIRLGTTISAALFLKKNYYIVHVGDCRIYELKDGICQLTKDQTLVGREVEQGILTEEQARRDPRRNILLQCIGASEKVKPVYIRGEILENAVYLLCSDGFRHVLDSEEIFWNLSPEELTSEAAITLRCRKLTELNRERGEKDNISVAVVKAYVPEDDAEETTEGLQEDLEEKRSDALSKDSCRFAVEREIMLIHTDERIER